MSESSKPSRVPIVNLPPVVSLLLVVMIAVHLARQFLSDEWDDLVVALFAFAPVRYLPWPTDEPEWPGGIAAALWSPITYSFLHVNWMHLVTNGAVFASLSNIVAPRMGPGRFLVFFVVTAVIAAFGELTLVWVEPSPVIGASGVVSALMGAAARFIFPASPARVDSLNETGADQSSDKAPEDGPWAQGRRYAAPDRQAEWLANLPIVLRPTASAWETLKRPKVIQFILAFGIMNVLLVFGAPALVGADGSIAWMVHLAGFVGGFLLFPLFDRVGTRFETPEVAD
jgi:membrane associated rhomboid family serine protease